MKSTTICAVVVAVATVIVPALVQAAPVSLYTFTTSHNTDVNSFNIGNEIRPTQKLYVSAIGAYLAPSQRVGGLSTVAYTSAIYADDNTTLLASATIPVGTSVNAQGFAYTPLTYVLNASTNYVLTSYAGPGLSAYSYGSPGIPTGTWNLGTTFIQNWYNAAGAGPALNTNGAYLEFLGANLLVDNVGPVPAPEPTSASLLGMGLLVIAHGVRRGKRKLAVVKRV